MNLLFFGIILFTAFGMNAQPVRLITESLITSESGTYKLMPQNSVAFNSYDINGCPVIHIDTSWLRQPMLGFGATFTDADIYNFMRMGIKERTNALKSLFDLNNAAGWSLMRISFGSSDWERNWEFYTYDDMPPGVKDDSLLSHFSVAEDKKREHFKLIREALQINPNLKIIAAVWGPPAWMKDNNKLITEGTILPQYYREYALYLVKSIQAYKREGIKILSVSPQNEPLCTDGRLTPQAQYIDRNQMRDLMTIIRKTFSEYNIETELWLFDHNFIFAKGWVQPFLADPLNRNLFDGVAWHDYGGSEQDLCRLTEMFPDIPMYLTEKAAYSVNGIARILSIIRCGARNYNHWVTITDEYAGPYQWQGGSDLVKEPAPASNLAALYNQRNSADSWNKTMGYYLFAQLTRFVKPDSRLIGSTNTGETLVNAAFMNPDGTLVLVVANCAQEKQHFAIEMNGLQISVELPEKSVGTYLLSHDCSPGQVDIAPGFSSYNSYTLVKNQDHILPLPPDIKSVAVIGPLADIEIPTMGITIPGSSLLDAIISNVSPSTTVLYAKGCNINDKITPVFDEAVAMALEADIIIMIMGADTQQISGTYPVNILPGKQDELIKVLQKTGKPLILVLVNKQEINPTITQNIPVIIEVPAIGRDTGTKIVNMLFHPWSVKDAEGLKSEYDQKREIRILVQ